MLKILIGDLFESKTHTLVNTVNCVGVMGKGIAQAFKKHYPQMFAEYVELCKTKKVHVGVPYLYKDFSGNSIINFPTKDHWRSPSKLENITNGLDIFIKKYKEWNVKSVAFPPLGCGNGGLDWEMVGPVMYNKLKELDIDIEIYAPYGTPNKELKEEFLSQEIMNNNSMTNFVRKKIKFEWVALLEIINQLQKQPYANPVGRTIFQKICYIFTEQNVDTEFHFKQGSYGPFSPDIKNALGILANANLLKEYQLGKMTVISTGPEFETYKNKYTEELKQLNKKIMKTVDLFSRIKSTEQAEEVTTILYSARKLKNEINRSKVSEQDIFDFILKWKKLWSNEEKQKKIAGSIRNLEMLGWLKLQYSESLNNQYLE